LCTEDKRYAEVVLSKTSVTTIVGAIATHLGVEAVVLAPFVALCLMVIINRGKEAYCKGHALHTKLTELKPDDAKTTYGDKVRRGENEAGYGLYFSNAS
jgi:hypothetical protein